MMKQQAAVTKMLTTIAGHMRDRRRILGLSQEGLAERAGVSATFVARIELGARMPSLGTLVRLAKALEVEVSDIVATENPRWVDACQELAHSLRWLPNDEVEFLLRQFRLAAEHIEHLLKERPSERGE